MSDFRIKLETTVEKGSAESQLNTIIKQLENKKLKLKINDEEFKTQIKGLTGLLNSAFKMDKTQLSNLNEFKNTLKEINKLSKQAQKSIFGQSTQNSGVKNEVVSVKNLIKEYDKLQAKQKTLEKQMSRTTNKQSYAELSRELVKIKSEAESIGKAIDKIGAVKGSKNLTDSLAGTFNSLSKQIDNTKTKMEGLFKNKNLTSDQSSKLNELKKELTELSHIELKKDILDAEKPYAQMSKLVRKIDEVKSSLKGFDIDLKLGDSIDKAKTSLSSLENKFNDLKKQNINGDFIDVGEINKVISDIERLKTEMSNIDINSSGATASFQRISNEIDQCENKFREFNNIASQGQKDIKFNADVSKVISDLDRLSQKCEEVGRSTDDVNKLRVAIVGLGNVSTSEAQANLSAYKKEISTIKSDMVGAGNAAKKTNGFFKNFYSSIAAYSIGDMLADGIQNSVRAIGSTILDLDSAFRDFSKVAPESFQGTTEQFDELKNKAISAGQEVAKSSVEIINSTANALQSGFKNVDQAIEYAKESAKFSNVSDMNQEDTDKALRSILSSYGGVENALKGTNSEIQNSTKSYSMLNRVMDASNKISIIEIAPYVQKCA